MKTQSAKAASQIRTKRRQRSNQPRALLLRRILVPIDFSGKSRRALAFAVPLAQRYGGRIFLLHVVQPPVVSTWEAIPGGDHYLTMHISTILDSARKHLEALALARVPAGLRGRTLVREGNPYSEITAAARQLKVDLLVISTHGHTGMRRILIGSVAERVVRHAPCAVLTVRRH
jgi:universal stress protein A